MSAADVLNAMTGHNGRPSSPHVRLQVLRSTLRVWTTAPANLKPDMDQMACRIAASLDYFGRIEAVDMLVGLQAESGGRPPYVSALLRAEDPGLFDALLDTPAPRLAA